MRVGVLTGGGDCPGLNAVIRAVVRKGVQDLRLRVRRLPRRLARPDRGRHLAARPARGRARHPAPRRHDPRLVAHQPVQDRRRRRRDQGQPRPDGLDALVAIGGEDTLGVATRLAELGRRRRRRAEDDRQRPQRAPTSRSASTPRSTRDGGDRPAAHDRGVPPPRAGRRGDGPPRGLDRAALPGSPAARRHPDPGAARSTSSRSARSSSSRFAVRTTRRSSSSPRARSRRRARWRPSSGEIDAFGHVRLGGIGEPLAARSRSGPARSSRRWCSARAAWRHADRVRPLARAPGSACTRSRRSTTAAFGTMVALRGHRHHPGAAGGGNGRAEDGVGRTVRRGSRRSSAERARGSRTGLGGHHRAVTPTLGPMTIPPLDELHALGAAQQPTLARPRGGRRRATATLRRMPPLVFAGECDELKAKLAQSPHGKAFLLQGGDCAETFDGVTADNVRAKLQVLLQMAVVLTYARVGPGRQGRPDRRPVRQAALERHRAPRRRDAARLPRRRGQRIRLHARGARRPTRIGWSRSTTRPPRRSTSCRAFLQGGYADLRQMHAWNTDFVAHQPGRGTLRAARRRDRPGARLHAARSGRSPRSSTGSTFHSSHEALILEYEHALTRIDSRTDAAVRRLRPLPLDRRAHPAARRRARRAASHVRNPIGVKLGPTVDARRRGRARREAQPRQRAGPADVHHPDGCAQDPRRAAASWSRR